MAKGQQAIMHYLSPGDEMGILARLIRRPLLSPITHIFSPWMKEELVRANGRSPNIMNNAALKMIVEEYA